MSKTTLWIGRVLTGLTGLFVGSSGVNILFFRSEDLRKGFEAFGFPEAAMAIVGWAALISSILYLIPRTAVLGAILMTGYLGGAVATHVRILDPTGFAALVTGILVWLGLFLREPRLRTLLPLRSE